MEDLKLIALDPEDLQVLSCHLQDAVIRVDWERAATDDSGPYQRRRAGLRFERVTSARIHGFDLQQKDTALDLLALTFEAGEEPSGAVTLHFAGGGAVRLEVECIEVELRDLGATWRANSKPV